VDLKALSVKLFKKILKKPSKKQILITAGGGVLIILLSAALFFFLRSGKGEKSGDTGRETDKVQVNKIDYDNMLLLKPFTWVSLKENSHMQKVSMRMVLELTSRDKVSIVEKKRDKIRAVVRGTAREMKWISLRGSEGKIEFKYALINKINRMFPEIVVRNLYFTHFIMR